MITLFFLSPPCTREPTKPGSVFYPMRCFFPLNKEKTKVRGHVATYQYNGLCDVTCHARARSDATALQRPLIGMHADRSDDLLVQLVERGGTGLQAQRRRRRRLISCVCTFQTRIDTRARRQQQAAALGGGEELRGTGTAMQKACSELKCPVDQRGNVQGKNK